jgi:ribonuclease VapC
VKPLSDRAVVLDSSAALAVLRREPGHERVSAVLAQAIISSVNMAEVLAKAAARGLSVAQEEQGLLGTGLVVEPFSDADARASAMLFPMTRALGLSLGDRACLALGQRLGLTVLTADHAWAGLTVGVTVLLIR